MFCAFYNYFLHGNDKIHMHMHNMPDLNLFSVFNISIFKKLVALDSLLYIQQQSLRLV